MAAPLTEDHANVLAPAPVFFGIGAVAGLLMEAIVPSGAMVSFKFGVAIGAVLIVASIGLVLSAVSELLRAKTAFDARKASTVIVTGGAFRVSRNPTYLSLTLLSIGIALVIPSAWLLATSAVAVGVTHWGVILREETYLLAKFGAPYRQYMAKVRRWL